MTETPFGTLNTYLFTYPDGTPGSKGSHRVEVQHAWALVYLDKQTLTWHCSGIHEQPMQWPGTTAVRAHKKVH